MPNLIGTYSCRIDSKSRLMLPAAHKKQLDPVIKQEFVLKKSLYNECLEFYPISEWNKETMMFDTMNKLLKDTRDLMRKFSAGFKTVELDNVGRLLIPKDLLEYSGIKNEVVVVSMINYLEIWAKAKYEKFENDPTINVAELAERVAKK